MKNNSANTMQAKVKFMNVKRAIATPLSDDAFYVLALASRLKKLLGPASLQHFLATGETVVFNNKAVV
jgi:hypothetical protein